MSLLFIVGRTDRGVCLISWVRYSAEIRQGQHKQRERVLYMHIFTHTYITYIQMSALEKEHVPITTWPSHQSHCYCQWQNKLNQRLATENTPAHRYSADDDPSGSAHNGVISPTGWKVSMTSLYSHLTGFNRFATCITTGFLQVLQRPYQILRGIWYWQLLSVVLDMTTSGRNLPTFRQNVRPLFKDWGTQHITQIYILILNPGFQKNTTVNCSAKRRNSC